MKTQNDGTEAAKKRAKKEYKTPVFSKFGRVADLTAGGSGAMGEMGSTKQKMKMP